MKNKSLKLLFLFFFIFLTFSYVKAATSTLVCAPVAEEDRIVITPKGPKATGWSSKISTCEFTGTIYGYEPHSGYDSYSAAVAAKKSLTYKTFSSETWDGKGVINQTVKVPLCDDKNAKVDAYTSCTATYYSNKVKAYCPCTSSTLDKSGCSDEEGELISGATYHCGYKCPDGYSESGVSTAPCVKTSSYDFKKADVSGNVAKSEAVTACKGANSGAAKCECKDMQYTLQCPLYACTQKYETINTCVPTYALPDGSPAYCVNPAQGFNAPENGNANYQVDTDFDVNKCASSNSTIDCGYANILIEAEYHRLLGEKVDDESINLALRLWGVHSGQNGYDKTGVANLKGCNCSEPIAFVPDPNTGEYANIYKYTHDYIMKHFKDLAYKHDYIPPEGTKLGETKYGDSLITITCNYQNERSMLGVVCGQSNVCGKNTGNTTIYRQAFDLYFNTLIGNKDMDNHLNYVVGLVDAEPDGITVITGEETSDGNHRLWLDIHYDEFQKLDIEEEVYDCKQLRESTQITDEDKLKILPYCKTTFYLVDANGNRVSDPIQIEECRKGSGCTTEEFEYAVVCSQPNQVTPIRIKAYYYTNSAPSIIQKYQSCANANGNQVMFGVVRDKISDSEDGDPTSRIIYEDPVETRGETKTFNVIIECPGEQQCSESGVVKNKNFGNCATNPGDSELEYTSDELYTNTISDPSLKCIVHMPETTRQMYDYSEHFGVNSNLCRVYCSDEVDYVLSNKINATAGETFDYDIEVAMYNEKKSDHHLSTIIEEKRTCVSEVYYHHNFPIEMQDKLKSIYNLSSAPVNIPALIAALASKAGGEGGRQEVVNQILFDLYNCNFYKEAFDSKIKTPKNSANARIGKDASGNTVKYVKTYNYAKYLYGSKYNNYGLNKICTIDGSNGTKCINMSHVNYEFGAETDTGKIENVYLESALDSLRNEGIKNIQYCTDTLDKKCLQYESGKTHQDFNYNNNNNWSNTSSMDTQTVFGKNYSIPTNDYAMFNVSVGLGFYNKERYQVKPGNGVVIDLANEAANEDYLTLEKYKYPITKNALTFDTNSQYCKTIASDSKNITKRCDVTQVLGASELNNTKVYTYYRNVKNDLFFNSINSSNNNFTCAVDVKIPRVTTCKNCDLADATIYRNVDTSKLFPNGVTASSNWATVEGQIATNAIESTSDMLRTSDDLLEYSISLSTTQIRALKEYNSHHKDYVNEPINNCTIKNDTYRTCKSDFLEILRGNTTELGSTTYGTIDPNHNGTKLPNHD